MCLCQEWLVSSCVLPGSPCVWLGLLNPSWIHRRSVRATWNLCRGSTASNARPRKSTSAKVSMCVCLAIDSLSDIFCWSEQSRLCVNRATTESDKVPLTLQHLNRVTIDLLNVVLIDLFLCLRSCTNQVAGINSVLKVQTAGVCSCAKGHQSKDAWRYKHWSSVFWRLHLSAKFDRSSL